TGDGEVLRVEKEASAGRREFRLDRDGFVANVITDAFPTGTVVHRSGALKGAVALTFDDGPDPTWTPKILDVLKQNGVPATFFVIGESAAREPGLVRRMEDEGHDVGSHSFSHPNLGVVGPERVRLELDGAQRAIQAATGRSTILFRPPYNADSTPQTAVELSPVAAASKLGYLTVGESVDPEDWLLRAPNGRERTAEEMAAEVLHGVEHGGELGRPNPGAAILLHDGGGDRSRSLEALRILIPALKAKGYRFVTVGRLLGLSHDQTMPVLQGRQRIVALMDSISFRLSSAFERGLGIAFATAIVLGVLRSVLIAALAIVHRRRIAARPIATYTPPVEVLVAAYNEEKTIARTIASLLASDYPDLGVLVVDDGSKDDTSGVVRREFGDDPRVRLVTKPNGGKASALNLALAKAAAPIVVGVDADTQLPPDAIRRLVAPLADPEIGMTAGNVKVGNVHNAVTTWQDVEYTTSQNLDRRAYALLNCVTVVPGAIGAWRREAVREIGGYQTDTLAEDMDLTWRLRQAGWRAETVPDARAYTEAPETARAFLKQRFRWTFGTLQCLWKHRSAVGRYGWFGGFALPSLWIFQIALQVIAPLVDLQIAWSLVAAIVAFADPVPKAYLREWNPQGDAITSLVLVLLSAGAFVLIEAITGLIAYRMDHESPKPLLWLPLQRFVYRQIMYLVVWSALRAAFLGARHGWGKLERTARVRLGASG
ncbi:glycosyltransferase, partial [bacterium]